MARPSDWETVEIGGKSIELPPVWVPASPPSHQKNMAGAPPPTQTRPTPASTPPPPSSGQATTTTVRPPPPLGAAPNIPVLVVPPQMSSPPPVLVVPPPILVPTLEPLSTSTPEPVLRPDQRHLALKEHMIELVNGFREEEGLQPIVLGDNIAAQLHAEQSLNDCISGHWGTDGLKPYMRYSLAGGFQANGENVSGNNYCIRAGEGYRPLGTTQKELFDQVRRTVQGWMGSPGHRKTILGVTYRKLNVGLAWDRYNFVAVQHFEGDHVEFTRVPRIENGILWMLEGRAKNGLRFGEDRDLGVQIYFDGPAHKLTPGQLSKTYCYDNGTLVASLRYPLKMNMFWPIDFFHKALSRCLDPYEMPPDTQPPQSAEAARLLHYLAKTTSEAPALITVPWITATQWRADGNSFGVEANLRSVLAKHGPGIYSVVVWGPLDGETSVIAEYSIFHEIDPPGTYDPSKWDK